VDATGFLNEDDAQTKHPEKEQQRGAENTITREWTGVDEYPQSPNR
jgi:hypothetical protein